MDEPLFKHLGSEKMIPMMKLLGMKENEVIEHSLVTKSIIKGQAKIAAQVTLEQSAQSQEEWLERNFKKPA
jgi:preprotein translocase subunit SecA